ncbi:hypothetical protein D1P53_004178 [Cryptococcus gattii VGV]|nr:hypothetical protein D1P53_004178 [Cryptococcus gattii VGV]
MSRFPQPFTSTVSHWQATNRGNSSLFGHHKEKTLPEHVIDYVVIGAGMADVLMPSRSIGASTAYHLTRPGVADGETVVVLEAKDVASGATGRNGGHCAPFSFAALPDLTKPLENGGAGIDMDEALDVLDFERRVLIEVAATVEKEMWEVDFWAGKKVEVRISEEKAKKMDEWYNKWLKARAAGKYKHLKSEWKWIGDAKEAQKVTRINGATGYSIGPAGSLHPHKLATAYLKSALATGQAELYSWSPVQKLTRGEDNELWQVNCGERGTVKARNVIVCTNAHTPHLFKGTDIDDFLTPFQGQAANVTPPPSFSGENYLDTTYTIEEGPYLIATIHAGIILGLYHEVAVEKGILEKKDVFGNVDDSYVQPAAKNSPGEGAMRFWSGIMCATKDTLPLDTVWRIALTTKYVVKLATTGEWDEGMPESFKISQDRLERGRTAPPYITAVDKIGGVTSKILNAVGVGGVQSVCR